MPIVPNFKPGIGRLVTDRFDFQNHVDGTAFRHVAGSIDLSPSILIGSTQIYDVQTAIAALSGSIIVPSVPDATLTSKGIIQLGGDLHGTGGTAAAPIVSGIQGRPISNTIPTDQQVLTWSTGASSWIPQTVPGAITLTQDLGGTPSAPLVIGIQGRSVSNAVPSSGQALVWNSGTSKWTPTGIPASPTGTGFATLTSGTYDAAATANIRYLTGKFQTDVNLQFKNTGTGFTGDLSWLPAASNKTLTLPNATDTLVGQATTDTLTNKTINATNNTITDASIATGDILAVIAGGKFTRLAKGVNGSFLGVSAGTLGYFTPSSSTPTGTGLASITAGVYDGTATANIRYTGGKLQTDANIQFKTAGQLGDLAWSTITTTRTITIPDATDTLVGKATTDIFSNKTINATTNTITDTSISAGDLFKSNGTSFIRFPRGTSLQVLRTNTGATDLEWASVSFPPTEVRINQTGAGQLLDVATSDGSSNPAAVIRFTGDGAATDILLSGLVAPANPNNSSTIRRLTLVCASTTGNRLILSQNDTNELTLINRFKFFGANNSQYVVGTDGYSIEIIWDNSDQRWRPVINLRSLDYGAA